jgi:hypothetical protein
MVNGQNPNDWFSHAVNNTIGANQNLPYFEIIQVLDNRAKLGEILEPPDSGFYAVRE